MAKVTKGRKAYCKKSGRETEELFANTMVALGCKVEKTSMAVDIHDHIDFFVDEVGFDVKGNRRVDYIWLELQNVQGRKGWLKGKAKYIAFYFTDLDVFKVFRRDDLLSFVEGITEETSSSLDFMKLYKRAAWGQDDIIVKVRLSDIEHLKHKNLKPC